MELLLTKLELLKLPTVALIHVLEQLSPAERVMFSLGTKKMRISLGFCSRANERFMVNPEYGRTLVRIEKNGGAADIVFEALAQGTELLTKVVVEGTSTIIDDTPEIVLEKVLSCFRMENLQIMFCASDSTNDLKGATASFLKNIKAKSIQVSLIGSNFEPVLVCQTILSDKRVRKVLCNLMTTEEDAAIAFRRLQADRYEQHYVQRNGGLHS